MKQEDIRVVARINKLRATTNIIIDTHAVTKEEWGFRITPFNAGLLTKLRLDVIIVLHRPYMDILKTSTEKPEGRLFLTWNCFILVLEPDKLVWPIQSII